ncbi:MAG TPA: ABC transporter substrate-binding protein [Candidatus Binatia bacterium]|jgi:NitT/TauT family transport system substrate-binding protein|nr:ABC transporter substrate-binding protein [Candidatus Binatia bacterium]HEU4640789.1 ABC transporter substrate-binding protein [Candidatus Binatia bacterium]
MKLLSLVALLWFCTMGEISAAPLRLSYSVVGPTVAGIWMAHEYGTFKKYGLDVQLVYIASSGTNIQALLGGSLDMSAPGISGVVLAAARGAPVLAIGAMTNRPPMTLYVHPDITRTEQLKGQTLGITRFNSTAHTVTTLILRKLGLEQTATMRPLGGQPEIQAAFEQKHIAGMVTAVKPRAPARALLNAADLDIPFAMNVMAVTREFLLKNPDTVERAMKAYIEAVAKMNNDKEATLKVLAKYFKRNDASFLDETYGIVTRFTEKIPRVDARNVSTVLEFEPVKGADAETLTPKVIDNSVVEKIAKEGFIEKVFGKSLR